MWIRNKYFLILLIFQLACNSDTIHEYNIQAIVEAKADLARRTEEIVKLELCDVSVFSWDKIVIIPPYSTKENIKKYKFENPRFVEEKLLDTLYTETTCLLLFLKNNTIMRYCYIPRETLNFSSINNKTTILSITRDIACERLYLKKENMNLKLYY